MSSPILQVENLSKYYQIRHDVVDPYSTLSGALADAGRNLFHYLLHHTLAFHDVLLPKHPKPSDAVSEWKG